MEKKDTLIVIWNVVRRSPSIHHTNFITQESNDLECHHCDWFLCSSCCLYPRNWLKSYVSWEGQQCHLKGAWSCQGECVMPHGKWIWENRACVTMLLKATLVLGVGPNMIHWHYPQVGKVKDVVGLLRRMGWLWPPLPGKLGSCVRASGCSLVHSASSFKVTIRGHWIHPPDIHCMSGTGLGSRKTTA